MSGLDVVSKSDRKIVFVGGHHTSALAVLDALEKNCRRSAISYQVYFIGHRRSMHGTHTESAEYREVVARGIPFFDLKAGKVYRTYNPREWLRIPYGFLQAFFILLRLRPALIVSFGGYLAVPVVFSGWLLGIPAVTHEQTTVSGWANRFIAKFVKKVFISWPQSERFFPAGKVVLTGLPLRREILALARENEATGEDQRGAVTIYVTGGKQGSQIINEALAGCLTRLLREFNIIHQCGTLDFDRFQKLRAGLSGKMQAHYTVADYFTQTEIGDVFRAADFVVGRAGAHTVYELAALGKPAILIPIPWVSHHEQQRNAEILAQVGLAKILPQKELNSEKLFQSCLALREELSQFERAGRAARKLIRLDAAERIASEIKKFL